jgi:hypothetical protein
MRDIMVKAGFNTSEADGMSGMTAQYKQPEEKPPAVVPKHELPKPIPVKKSPETGERKVETTTLSFPIKFEMGMRQQFAILEVPNVSKKTADDLGAASRYVEGLLKNPKALGAAVRNGDVRITTMATERSELSEREKGERAVPVALGKQGVRYVEAGAPTGEQKKALLDSLSYLDTMGKPAAFAGIVVPKQK